MDPIVFHYIFHGASPNFWIQFLRDVDAHVVPHLDFIANLPPSKSFDSIVTIVNQFTKTIYSEKTANVVIREVFWHGGLLDDILMIVAHNPSQNSGSTCLRCPKSLINPLQTIIHKATIKFSIQTKH